MPPVRPVRPDRPDRRVVLRRLLVSAAAAPAVGRAQSPPQPVPLGLARILLGAPPGGGGDGIARRVAEQLRGTYARAVLVDNRPGAGGQLAVQALRLSPADGSVLLLAPSSLLSIFPHTHAHLAYRPESDLTPVSLAAEGPLALAVGPAVPAAVGSLGAFLDWAAHHPAQASYGSPAAGSIAHLLMALVSQRSGVPLVHVAYRGSAEALQDLRAGVLAAVSAPLAALLPQARAGALRVLAVSGEARSELQPQVPTLREVGLDLCAREWYGFFLPAPARPEVTARAATALQQVLAQPEVVARLGQLGLQAASSSPAALGALIHADRQRWATHIRQLGFSAWS